MPIQIEGIRRQKAKLALTAEGKTEAEVDFETGERKSVWLDEKVIKYHRTFEEYCQLLFKNNFTILNILEPRPRNQDRLLDKETDANYRRPAFLMFLAMKT